MVRISGKLQEIKTHPCEKATGQAELGTHLILKDKNGREFNIHLGPAPATGTIHCRDEDPANCGPELAKQLEARFGYKRFGLVGLQPAILKALAGHFDPEFVRVVDLDLDNVGSSKYGIEVWDGQSGLPRLVEWSEVGLATGSSIVNGTIDKIIRCFKDDNKPLVFFGNTISGAAALLGIDRLCPFGR